MRVITDQKLEKYFKMTGDAIRKVKIAKRYKKKAEDCFDMAKRYYSDAEYFKLKGNIVNAFACLNYSHGWLDCGARLGLFDVGGDSKLFTVDGKRARK